MNEALKQFHALELRDFITQRNLDAANAKRPAPSVESANANANASVLCTKHPSPSAHERWPIKESLLRFDSQRLLHKNARWHGVRYVIVFFKKNMNYAGQDIDGRSTKLAALDLRK
jgi:hypothetical protein